MAREPNNHQLALVECHRGLLTVTRMATGTDDLVPTLTGRADHGGELIWAVSNKYSKFPLAIDRIVAGQD